MRKQLFVFLAALFLSAALFTHKTYAFQMAGQSAQLAVPIAAKPVDVRADTLRTYLKAHNSPLADYADVFIAQADKYQIDWKLLPAISGVESTYGLALPQGSYNAWGYGIYGNQVRTFSSWEDAISTISHDIRTKYMDTWKATNVEEIGHIYAASPTWAYRVEQNINEIEVQEVRSENATLSISF